MKYRWFVFLMIGFVSEFSHAQEIASESDLQSFAQKISEYIQTRPDCSFTMNSGDYINPKNISVKIKAKHPNLKEEFGVTFTRECAGDPKSELKITWKIESIDNVCVAGTIVNNHRDVELDKEISIDVCSLENYLQLTSTSSANPWWKLANTLALDNSNWQ